MGGETGGAEMISMMMVGLSMLALVAINGWMLACHLPRIMRALAGPLAFLDTPPTERLRQPPQAQVIDLAAHRGRRPVSPSAAVRQAA